MMKNTRLLLIALCAAAIAVSASIATFSVGAEVIDSFTVNAPSAILIDADTGTVLYEQNSKEHRPVASMVKIMTLLLTFDAIDEGRLSPDDNISVSENASSMGGSQAFLDAHAEYNVGELIKAITIASANDACVAMAEHLSGSVDGFVSEMNAKAATLGMDDTNFVNCTGLPAPNQYSCAYDASVMFRALISHEAYFDYSKIWMFDFEHPSGRKTMLSNTNKLIRAYEGCDGGKTGFTNEAMYCLSATAERNGTRLISVVTGAQTSKGRNAEICKLFDFGFAHFETRQVVFGGVELENKFEVRGSKEKAVGVAPESDGFLLTEKGNKSEITYAVEFDGNIALPLPAGSPVGKIIVYADGDPLLERALVTTGELTKPGYLDILDEIVKQW